MPTWWERSIRLGDALDGEQVSAQHVHGRLTVLVAGRRDPARKIEVVASPPEVTSGDDDNSQPDGDTNPTD